MLRDGEVGLHAKDHQFRVRLSQKRNRGVIAPGAQCGNFFRRHSMSFSCSAPPAARFVNQAAAGHADYYPTVLIASLSSATHSLTSGDGSAGFASYSMLM